MSNTDYDNNDVKIITKPVQSQNPVLIEGFPGIGLVGNIASQHIIEELRMEYIGSIDSRYFPSIAVLYEGLSNALVDWAESINVREIASIAGIAILNGGHKVFGAATTPEMLSRIRDKVEIFQMGTISGISGSVMAECLQRGIPAFSLLGATRTQNPDPRAASAVIEVLNELYGLSISTARLIEFRMYG